MRTNNILECHDRFRRCLPRAIQPRFICQQDGLNDFEQEFLDEISYRIVHEQQSSTVIFPITLAALSFLQSSTVNTRNRFISMKQIYTDKNTLLVDNSRLLDYSSSNYQVYWPSDNDEQHLKQRLLTVYSDVFDISGDKSLRLKMTGDRLSDTSLLMKLVMYRNTCLHLFAKSSYILLACQMRNQVNEIMFYMLLH
jgi:hypothetical protein